MSALTHRLPVMPESTEISPEVWFGIDRLLFDYAELEVGDDVVIAYTPDVRIPASWVCLALHLLGMNYSIVPMEPLSDRGFIDRLRAKIPQTRSASGKCVVLVFEWETMSHNQIFRQVFSGHRPEQRRIVRCINAGRDLFAVGLRPTPQDLSRRNADLLHFLRESQNIRITTYSGTDLSVHLDASKYQWISNRGFSEQGRMIVLPPGEIATFPAQISGVLVADYAVNVNYLFDGDVRLENHPVTVEINDSELVRFACDDQRIAAQLRQYFAMTGARRVGELGFGTHPAIGAAVPDNSHLNERRVGVHLGFGQHNQTDEIAGYTAQVHVDLIAAGGSVHLADGTEIRLDRVPATGAPHPQLLQSVDVFSPDIVPPDCCSIVP